MSGRALTIELSDEEYRRLAEIAERRGVDVGEVAREGIRTVMDEEEVPAQAAASLRKLEQSLKELRAAQASIKPWAPGEFQQFLAEAKRDRDERPLWP